MIRNIKLLAIAALALAALGAVTASGAQGAEFHCTTEPCTYTLEPDEVVGTKTAHQVFILKNSINETVSFTCNQLTGQATVATKTATAIRLKNLNYGTCTLAGQVVTVSMNGCEYEITASGQLSILCPAGKKIEWSALNCKAEIGSQGPLSTVKYHNIGTKETVTTKITLELSLAKVAATMVGTQAACGMNLEKTPFTAEFTTGNGILNAETDTGSPTAKEAWWV